MGGVAWTEEEDLLLKKCIQQYGEGKWHRVPLLAGLNRCRKSCRLRWLNYLRPNIKRGSFTEEEVEMIIKLHRQLGNRWSLIAGRLPGRTANDVKNYWNCHLSKKLNAQEGEQRQMSRNNAQVIKPHQLRNIAAASTSGIKLQSGPPDENEYSPAAPLKRGVAMPSPTVFNVDADHQGHMLSMQTQEDNTVNVSCLDQQGIGSVVGDLLPTDLHFEQVESTKDFKDGCNKWDWDDLLADMDLYNDSL